MPSGRLGQRIAHLVRLVLLKRNLNRLRVRQLLLVERPFLDPDRRRVAGNGRVVRGVAPWRHGLRRHH